MADVHLPDGILHNILARLPAKPLLRSRCVSKRWNAFISDPSFMKLRSCRKMLVVSPPLYILDGAVPVDNLAHPPSRLRYLFETQSGVFVKIIGTFNGIVLLKVRSPNAMGNYVDQLILYNPFTGASKHLHDPYREMLHVSPLHVPLYGFCYGETSDDLMIVRFRDYTNKNWKTCDVFNLKRSLWSTSEILIQDADCRSRARGEIGTFANGFLYWIASNKIVALNVREMVISEISLPAAAQHTLTHFGTLHGCLCMIALHSTNWNDFDVWVMKEHGVENLWSIVHSIQLPFDFYEFINTMDDGRILMVDSEYDSIIYDTLKYSHKTLNIPLQRCSPPGSNFHAVEYVESLISPSDICGV